MPRKEIPIAEILFQTIKEITPTAVFLDDNDLEEALYPGWINFICRIIEIRAGDPDLGMRAAIYFRELPRSDQLEMFANSEIRFEVYFRLFKEGQDAAIEWLATPVGTS